MLLDIVVTHYKEPWEVAKPLFDMLGLQRGVSFSDFRVILVNDGEENHIPDVLLVDYPYEIHQIDIPHGGVSAARNAGLEYSTADWVNFCDCDDTYTNIYAIRDILNVIKDDCKFDFLWTQLITEDFTEKEGPCRLILTPKKTVFVFIHGKIYRREWLINNGIRFDTNFAFQEDSLFNAMVLGVIKTERVGQISTLIPPYVWCRRRGSVTNSEANADKATWYHFKRNCKVCEFYRDKLPDRLSHMVVRTVYDTFFMVTSKRDISLKMRNNIVDAFKEFLKDYGQYYAKPEDDELLAQIQEISLAELMQIPVNYDFETVTNWKNLFEGTIE